MAISDELFAICLSVAFNYLILHRYNRFFAGITGMGIGLSTLYFGYTAGAAYNMPIGLLGLVIITGSFATLIYDVLSINDRKT